jgi:hypothetical protein
MLGTNISITLIIVIIVKGILVGTILEKPHQNHFMKLNIAIALLIGIATYGEAAAQKPGIGGNTGSTTNTNTQTTPTTGSKGGIGTVIQTVTGGSGAANFTQTEAANAIKEALTKGITAAVDKVSVTDGFFKNNFIKIPFPQDAKAVESALRQIGLGSMIDNLVLSLNRAAESAAKQATPIFVNSIKQMTITDAINIVNNKQTDAATRFLERTTTEQLVVSFKPAIKTALDKTLATKYWSDIMTRYNKIPFVRKVNTDLPDYATRKAISGLFYMVAQEEAKIRKDPKAAASSIIEKVFGSVKF